MPNKEASSYGPNDPLAKCVADAYGRSISPASIKGFIEGVVSYDGLYETFLTNPSSVSRDIFSSEITGHVCIPCYTLELRQILKSRTLVSSYKILGMSLESAKRYLGEYPVFLVIEERSLHNENQVKLNGARLYDNEFHFGESLVRVLVRDRGDSDTMTAVTRIVGDIASGVEVGVITDAPGLNQRVAQTMPVRTQLRKYVVNVPTLGIDNEVVKSESDVAALGEALNRKWQQTGNPHKDPKYTAEYWLNSPMVPRESIVREAEAATYIVKEAAPEQPQQQAQPQQAVAPAAPKQQEKKKQPVKLNLPLKVEPDEKAIFDLLLKVNQQFNLGLTFRVAGGWVRDRALGKPSKDIDIALDKMTGAQFCKYITKATGKVPAIIAADAAKSKSLETATIRLGDFQNEDGSTGLPIDFVNLRKEVYEPGSRTPTMTFGTAEEDAERRDFTLNALFYNVNTGEVEDFTGKGLTDLANLTIRTPLDPKQTFADDPLRVFRALRFLAKFKGSEIEKGTLAAIHDPEVQEALDPKNTIDVEVTDPKTGKVKIEKQRKISEERILVEWQKLFRGPQAAEALRIAHDSGLWQKVFVAGAGEFESDVEKDVPVLDENGQPVLDENGQPKMEKKRVKTKRNMANEFHPFTMDQNNAWHVDNVFEHTMKVVAEYDKILQADGADDDERARALAAAFLHDIGKLDPSIIGQKEVEGILRNTYHGHEDISALAAEAILKGIKSSNEEIEYIKTIVKHHMIPHNKMTDKQINKMIRNLGRSLVKRIVQHAKADSLSKPGGDTAHYDNLLDRVQNAFAVEPNQVKPVLDGGTIMKLFPGLKAQSGFIKEIQDHLQDMKDGYPQLSQEEALVEVENMRAGIMSKYQNWVGTPKAKQPPKQQPQGTVPAPVTPHPIMGKPLTPPPAQASVKPFNLTKQAESGSVEMVCGKVYKHKFGVGDDAKEAVFILTDGGEEFKLKRGDAEDPFNDPELDKLVGKRVCGKGMIHKHLFVMSEYSVVNLGKDEDVVQMKRKVPDDMTSFSVGDKVRHRKRGLAFEQITGRVEKIDHGLMFIKWDGVKELEVFDLNDSVAIHGILQKL